LKRNSPLILYQFIHENYHLYKVFEITRTGDSLILIFPKNRSQWSSDTKKIQWFFNKFKYACNIELPHFINVFSHFIWEVDEKDFGNKSRAKYDSFLSVGWVFDFVNNCWFWFS
jgi:hypothetical protein